eukprot:CAMPEP_0172746466 /NCGR_PEP_ID=MMETSP1074-20121228/140663_1 /TAXON_ID=2916 /ORGANISM="Ceratium fusus, Strain PA161109" /LENGTH=46 /DNA_ID= /DNA_START= /DNA_END= /DNA_ORIENTATION=
MASEKTTIAGNTFSVSDHMLACAKVNGQTTSTLAQLSLRIPLSTWS